MPNNKRKFLPPRSSPETISQTSSACDYFAYYCARQGMSENQVCTVANINQAWFNRVVRCNRQTNDIAKLISVCIVLGLTPTEAMDFLARIERALSPSNPIHQVYLEILKISCEKMQFDDAQTRFEFANRYLQERGYAQLPY